MPVSDRPRDSARTARTDGIARPGAIGRATASPATRPDGPADRSRPSSSPRRRCRSCARRPRGPIEPGCRPSRIHRERRAAQYARTTAEPSARRKRPARRKASRDRKTAKRTAPLAIVTSYRYFDDITVFSTVDLATGQGRGRRGGPAHPRRPLSRRRVRGGRSRWLATRATRSSGCTSGSARSSRVYPQFSQFVVKDDPRRHRVVHLNYRVGKRDLSYPRPQVDLTTREVESSRRRRPSPRHRRGRRRGGSQSDRTGGPGHASLPLPISARHAPGVLAHWHCHRRRPWRSGSSARRRWPTRRRRRSRPSS